MLVRHHCSRNLVFLTPQPIHQVVATRLGFMITFLFALTFIWIVLPKGRVIHPFPVWPEQAISVQAYSEYIMERVFICALMWLIQWMTGFRFLRIYAILFVGYLIDFFPSYNNPYFYLSQAGITSYNPGGWYFPGSYPMFMIFIMLTIAIQKWLTSTKQ